MKILYITLEDMSLHKGSVIHTKEVIERLQGRGYQVGLMAMASGPYEGSGPFYNLHMRALGRKKSYVIASLLLFLFLFRYLSRYRVLYARDFHTVIIALLPRVLFNRKLVFEINGIAHEEQRLKSSSWLNQFLSFFIKISEKLACRYSDRIVSVTPQICNYLIRYFRCRSDKIEVVGNGVDTRRFRPIEQGRLLLDYRKRFGISKGDITVAFVGNIAFWQGVDILLNSALPLLSKDGYLKFLVVGDGLLKDPLVKKVLDAGYEKNVIFAGMVRYEDIPFIINIADICVAPFIARRNRVTGVSPLKVFEYMACGKPVICSRIEGLEFVETERAGYLVEPEDIKDLQEKLVDLIHDPGKRAAMGREGLHLVREKFDWGLKVTKIEKILKALA
jgi:glycosyltransferase involved in cell wall biosynthesis